MYITLKHAVKQYGQGETAVYALDDASFELEKGKICVILGPSGSGKSTLLNMLGGLDTLDAGELIVDGKTLTGLNKKKLTEYRKKDVGFVFQFYNLIQNLTALENVEMAVQISKTSADAAAILERVGLSQRSGNFPSQLSGGEQQRVSIARALAKKPKLLLCDEPTGALDYATGKAILKLLYDTCREENMTVVVISHNQAIAPMADKVIKIKNGQAVSVTVNETPKPVEEIEW